MLAAYEIYQDNMEIHGSACNDLDKMDQELSCNKQDKREMPHRSNYACLEVRCRLVGYGTIVYSSGHQYPCVDKHRLKSINYAEWAESSYPLILNILYQGWLVHEGCRLQPPL